MISENVFIVAEAGVNHNGDVDLAFQLVDVAIAAKVDAIKFQVFKAEDVVTRHAVKAEYQIQNTKNHDSQFTMLKNLELPNRVYRDLKSYCEKNSIKFLSTAFDTKSLNFLNYELGLDVLKIPSGEITNGPLLLDHAKAKRDLIVSTGIATTDEIEKALSVIAFGLVGDCQNPSHDGFRRAFDSDIGQQLLKDKVTLLHCTSEYPTPIDEVNLKAITTMKKLFGLRVGYSDHTEGIIAAIAAASLGANVIEKHFTLDKALPGPDHKASVEPDELNEMVESIRTVELMQGDGFKVPTKSELRNRQVIRKSIVAAKDIQIGENYTEQNLTFKRPGTGRNPMEYWDLLGTESPRSNSMDEIIP